MGQAGAFVVVRSRWPFRPFLAGSEDLDGDVDECQRDISRHAKASTNDPTSWYRPTPDRCPTCGGPEPDSGQTPVKS
jgi:hypothetical protein